MGARGILSWSQATKISVNLSDQKGVTCNIKLCVQSASNPSRLLCPQFLLNSRDNDAFALAILELMVPQVS